MLDNTSWNFLIVSNKLLELFNKGLCCGFVDPWALYCLIILLDDFILDVEGFLSNLAYGSWNALPDLSLFPLVFIFIFSRLVNECVWFLFASWIV